MDSILNLFHKNSGHVANTLIVMLIIYMGWSLASAILFFAENTSDLVGSRGATRSLSPDQPKVSSQVDLSLLDLFGSVDSAKEVDQPVDAPETRLNLQLKGVFKAAVKEESTAIVAERNKEGNLYRIGELLPGKAILFDVFADHILIKRGTAVEKLMFDDNAFRTISAQETIGSAIPSMKKRAMVQPELPTFGLIGQDQTGVNGDASSRQALRSRMEEYKTKFESDPATVLAEFGLSPVEEGNKNGYQLDSGSTSPLLKRSGLQEGDVVLSVNGTPVGDAANESALIESSMKAKRLRIEVQRGSRRFFVTVPVP